MKRRDQIGGPEPRAQRQPRPMHHRARGHRALTPTPGADPQMPARLPTGIAAATPRAHEPLRPARGKHYARHASSLPKRCWNSKIVNGKSGRGTPPATQRPGSSEPGMHYAGNPHQVRSERRTQAAAI
jgi:hypothetical protein